MNGDAKPDLVVTSVCNATASPIGDQRWDVYLNTGQGFASTPTPWALPSAQYPSSFGAFTNQQ